MGSDQLVRAVRQQVSLGRILPLGGPADGAWIAERAARTVLLRETAALPGVRVEAVRLRPVYPETAEEPEPVVPPPPSGLPPLPLRIEADLSAVPDGPLPARARQLRIALGAAAEQWLGLEVAAIDVHVAGLLDAGERGDGGEKPAGDTRADAADAADAGSGAEDAGDAAGAGPPPPQGGPVPDVSAAVLAVPGVRGLSRAPARPVRTARTPGGPDRLVPLDLVAGAGHRALDVARAAARAAAAASAPGPVRVRVLITDIRADGPGDRAAPGGAA